MDEPKSLDSLFKQKIFRIPDYQRGYAWQHEQIKDFWEDLINLSESRSHYTGVLTLKQIPTIATSDKEYWLVEDHSYQVYHVVDGQQRLTTFIIFLQAFVDFLKMLPDSKDKPDADIYLTENLNVTAVQATYLFKIKPTGTSSALTSSATRKTIRAMTTCGSKFLARKVAEPFRKRSTL